MRTLLTWSIAIVAEWLALAARPQSVDEMEATAEKTEGMAAVLEFGGHAIFKRRNKTKDGVQRWLAIGKPRKQNATQHSQRIRSDEIAQLQNASKQRQNTNVIATRTDNIDYGNYRRKAEELKNHIEDLHVVVKDELDPRADYLLKKGHKYVLGMQGLRNAMDKMKFTIKHYRNTMRKDFKSNVVHMLSKLDAATKFAEMHQAQNTLIPKGMWADAIVPAIRKEVDEEYTKPLLKGAPPPKRNRESMSSDNVEAARAVQANNPYWIPNVVSIYKDAYAHGYDNASLGVANGVTNKDDLRAISPDTFIWTENPGGLEWYKDNFRDPHERPPKAFAPFTEKELNNCKVKFGPEKEDVIAKFLASGWIRKRTHKLIKPTYEWTVMGREAVENAGLIRHGRTFESPIVGSLVTPDQLTEIGGAYGPLDPGDGVEAGFLHRRMKVYELEWTRDGAVYMLTEMVGNKKRMPKAIQPRVGDSVTEDQLEWIEELENADVDIEAGIDSGMWREVYGCSCRDYCPLKRWRAPKDDEVDGTHESIGKDKRTICEGLCDEAPEGQKECKWERAEEEAAKLARTESNKADNFSPKEREAAKFGLHDLPAGFYSRAKKHLNLDFLTTDAGDSLTKERSRSEKDSDALMKTKFSNMDRLSALRNAAVEYNAKERERRRNEPIGRVRS